MKNNLKFIITIIISVIISSGITAYAATRFQANQIGYDTTTVADALDSMYQTMFSNNYSTNEKVVGKWTDGKILYQRTYNINISFDTGTSSWRKTGIIISDCGTLVDVKCLGNDNRILTGMFALWHLGANNELELYNNTGYGNANIVSVTIQYTKTTD